MFCCLFYYPTLCILSYANPANDRLKSLFSRPVSMAVVEITDMAGRLQLMQQLKKVNRLITIANPRFVNGNYIVRIVHDGE